MARYSRRAESFATVVGWLFSPTVWKVLLFLIVLRVVMDVWQVLLVGIVVFVIYLLVKSFLEPKLDAEKLTNNEFIQVETSSGRNLPNVSAVSKVEEMSGNFLVRNDGTVTDTRTGLMWMRCVQGQTWDGQACVRNEVPPKYTWNQAMALRHDFAGYNDWRLPSIDELKGVFSAFDTQIFPDCLINPIPEFWSSSLDDNNIQWPLSISFGGTYRGYSEHSYRVRLVRDDRNRN